MPRLSRRGEVAPPSPIRKLVPLADAARARGIHVYHVNIGQPDLPTPEPMRRAVREYAASVFAYAPATGTAECRRAIVGYYRRCLGTAIDADEVLVTTAGSEAIQFALGACLDPGDRVLIPEPMYPNYLGFAALLGVEVTPIPCALADGYHLPAALARHVDSRTRAILFANPGNPTGTVYRPAEIEAIAALAREHDLYVIADEVYREFIFAGSTISTLDLDDMAERVIVVDSLSKRFSACGIRIGALVTRNRAVMDAARRFAMARLSAPALGQVAAAAIGEIPDSYFDEMRATYRRRRDAVVAALRAIPGVSCPEPEGAFYTMAALPVADAEDFTRFLLTDFALDGATTMVAPGSGFYKTPGAGRSEIRVAYVLDEASLGRAIEILGAGLAAYRARRGDGSDGGGGGGGAGPASAGTATGASGQRPSKT